MMKNCTLLNKDCLDAMQEIASHSVDLILSDPPYNLGVFMQNRDTNLKRMRENYFGAAGWDNLSVVEWETAMNCFFAHAGNIIKIGGSLIVFMAIIKVGKIIEIAQKYGFYYKTTGIWHKTNPMPRNMNLHFINSTETWIYFVYKKKTGTFNNDGKAVHDFFESSVVSKKERLYGSHPTQKPEAIMGKFIELLSNQGETVLDPFMGSGTTGVVAKKLKRNFIGVELDNQYFEIARQRIMAEGEVEDV